MVEYLGARLAVQKVEQKVGQKVDKWDEQTAVPRDA